ERGHVLRFTRSNLAEREAPPRRLHVLDCAKVGAERERLDRVGGPGDIGGGRERVLRICEVDVVGGGCDLTRSADEAGQSREVRLLLREDAGEYLLRPHVQLPARERLRVEVDL